MSEEAKKTRIAVIGGGPGGMSFCHAMELAFLEGRADRDRFAITALERSPMPGGIWKSASEAVDTREKINMYKELWTNGPASNMEFADYPYEQHFGPNHKPTVYLPRQQVLEYLTGRVTCRCPDFFERYFEFGKEVNKVTFDETSKVFTVTTKDMTSGSTTDRTFDKVIWACGQHGETSIPSKLSKVFRNFTGRLCHSSDTSQLEKDFAGKRVLLIGGAYSAEDLAYQACKLGVEHVTIVSRTEDCDVVNVKEWPHNKVTVIVEQTPVNVTNDNVIQLAGVKYDWEEEYIVPKPTEVLTELKDIDTVVFCTGYKCCFDMLEKSLRPGFPKDGFELEVPDDWVFPDNALTKYFGQVPVEDAYWFPDYYTHPEMYQGALIRNTNMMFIWTYGSSFPLLAADASAWCAAKFCIDPSALPAREEMDRQNHQRALEELKFGYIRYWTEEAYQKAAMAMDDDANWEDDWDEEEYDEAWEEVAHEVTRYELYLLAHHMRAGNYNMDLGDIAGLNELGEKFLALDTLSGFHRSKLSIAKDPDKTFRDYDDADKFYSIFTGGKFAPLPGPWMKLDTDAFVKTAAEAKASLEEKKEDDAATNRHL